MNNENQFKTKRDIMIQYKISVGTVNRYMKIGLLPYHKIGKKIIRFSKEDLEKFEFNMNFQR